MISCSNCKSTNVKWTKLSENKVWCNRCEPYNAPIDWLAFFVGVLVVLLMGLVIYYLPQILI